MVQEASLSSQEHDEINKGIAEIALRMTLVSSMTLRDIPLIWSQLGVPVKYEPYGYNVNQQNMTNWKLLQKLLISQNWRVAFIQFEFEFELEYLKKKREWLSFNL